MDNKKVRKKPLKSVVSKAFTKNSVQRGKSFIKNHFDSKGLLIMEEYGGEEVLNNNAPQSFFVYEKDEKNDLIIEKNYLGGYLQEGNIPSITTLEKKDNSDVEVYYISENEFSQRRVWGVKVYETGEDGKRQSLKMYDSLDFLERGIFKTAYQYDYQYDENGNVKSETEYNEGSDRTVITYEKHQRSQIDYIAMLEIAMEREMDGFSEDYTIENSDGIVFASVNNIPFVFDSKSIAPELEMLSSVNSALSSNILNSKKIKAKKMLAATLANLIKVCNQELQNSKENEKNSVYQKNNNVNSV